MERPLGRPATPDSVRHQLVFPLGNGLQVGLLARATYFLSWAAIRVTDATGMDRWRKRLFVAIWRNSANSVEYLRLPDRRAITMGWEVPL